MTTHENDPIESERLTRRGSLLRLAGLAAAAGGAGALRIDTAAAGPLAVSSGFVKCVLTPELTEGPYYVAGEKLRRDVTEGKSGTSLLLNLTVVNASTCKPVKNASVEIWHCDAGGVYSGAVANNPGTNFLRGVQKTNAVGVATFKTIYPGFYQGRAVHIHVKVHVGGTVVHTGQLVLPRERDERRLQACAIQRARNGLNLPQRRQQGNPDDEEERNRLRRHDRNGRASHVGVEAPSGETRCS
jgi:protocatechuate 3,4-dioxygenase beta subunit